MQPLPPSPGDDRDLFAVAPFLLVKDLSRSIAFYTDVLGFTIGEPWGDPPYFAMAERDGLTIMLHQVQPPLRVRPNGGTRGAAGAGPTADTWDLYLWCRDAEALFEDFKNRGAEVVYEPVVQPDYTMKEFALRDADGYVLAFGQWWDQS
jgi:catechol 2,3-dioxygenase-like lactoylglutathione lyase family enzyme